MSLRETAQPSAAPHPARTMRPGRRPGALASLGLVVAGALVVLAGAAGGWTVTRALAGESPLSATVSSVAADTPLVAHTDPLGFVAQVPANWVQDRPQNANGAISVRFVSRDGHHQVQLDKITGQRGQPASIDAFTKGLTAAAPRVDVTIETRPQVVPGATGANPPQQLRYRTTDGTTRRITLVRLVPHGNDLFVLRLSMPAESATAAADTLFERIASGFKPT